MRAHRVASFDLGDVLVGELEVRRGEDRVDLVGAAEADDRAVDGRVAQRPRDRDRARRGVVALGDGAQSLDQLEVAGQLRLAGSARRACASRRRRSRSMRSRVMPPVSMPEPIGE